MRDRDILLSRWSSPSPQAGGTWTSPVVTAGFAATELIASWVAATPGESSVRVEVRGLDTPWKVIADWAYDERTSTDDQQDEHGRVDADTFKAAHPLHGWQVRLTCSGDASVERVYLLASGSPAAFEPSRPAKAMGVVLDVPRYAQLLLEGGESLCSPTSTAMVLSYWGVVGTSPDHAARHTFDRHYDGCGNWPFNTAYAGRFGVEAFVTRLRSLNEAELFIEAGIPLVVSASYRDDEVPGLRYDTEGHLMVLAGFTDEGDPVLNDPYAPSNDEVRKSVGRAQWEAAWQRASGGIAYVIHPASVPLPPAPAQANW